MSHVLCHASVELELFLVRVATRFADCANQRELFSEMKFALLGIGEWGMLCQRSRMQLEVGESTTLCLYFQLRGDTGS